MQQETKRFEHELRMMEREKRRLDELLTLREQEVGSLTEWILRQQNQGLQDFPRDKKDAASNSCVIENDQNKKRLQHYLQEDLSKYKNKAGNQVTTRPATKEETIPAHRRSRSQTSYFHYNKP